MRKIGYLDGLRGIAAFQVVFHHFVLAFFPAVFLAPGVTTHFAGDIEARLSASPLNILWDGNFAVCLFFVLSGYVLSHKFFLRKEHEIATASAVKRYFRLALPVAFSVLLAYIFMKLGLFYNQQAGAVAGSGWLPTFWTFSPNLFDALSQAFLGTFFYSTFDYNAVLWTIAYEFEGSFLVFSFLSLVGTAKNRWWAYVAVIWVFYQSYYLAFVLGMLLSDIIVHRGAILRGFGRYRKWLDAAILLLGLFIASYPSGRDADGTLYLFMKYSWIDAPAEFYHIVGAALIMVALLDSRRLQQLFSCRPFLFLGDISFTMYLLHFVIMGTFSSFVFLKLQPLMSYPSAVLGSFLLSIPIIFIVSYLAYIYVDRRAVAFAQYFYDKVFNKK